MRELREPNAPFFVPMYKETLLAANDLPSTLLSVVLDLLQEYGDVLHKEVPPRLPLKRGIEHQIDLVPGAPLPKIPHIESAKRGELSDSTKCEECPFPKNPHIQNDKRGEWGAHLHAKQLEASNTQNIPYIGSHAHGRELELAGL